MKPIAVNIFFMNMGVRYVVGENDVQSIASIYGEDQVIGIRITHEKGVLEFFNVPISLEYLYDKEKKL